MQMIAVIIEQWVGGYEKPACRLCYPFIGNLYEQGKGPRPVIDTHPGCKCERIYHHIEWRIENDKPVDTPN